MADKGLFMKPESVGEDGGAWKCLFGKMFDEQDKGNMSFCVLLAIFWSTFVVSYRDRQDGQRLPRWYDWEVGTVFGSCSIEQIQKTERKKRSNNIFPSEMYWFVKDVNLILVDLRVVLVGGDWRAALCIKASILVKVGCWITHSFFFSSGGKLKSMSLRRIAHLCLPTSTEISQDAGGRRERKRNFQRNSSHYCTNINNSPHHHESLLVS